MTTCPACGVAIVPGYVKCPRCGARLPSIKFRRPGTTADAGGTAVEGPGGVPWIPIAAAVAVALAIILVFALRRGGKDEPAPPPAPAPVAAAQPAPPAPKLAPAPPPFVVQVDAAVGPRPEQIADDLRRTLDHQRLWATVTPSGTTLEIRSGSCGDPLMKPALDAAAPAARAAGLTRLRCVEQSGAVAFTREL